jgi:hypothetical protein
MKNRFTACEESICWGGGLNHRRMAGVLLHLNKMHHLPPRAVKEKENKLVEDLRHRLALATFTQPREARGYLLQPAALSQKPGHQAQPVPAAQGVFGGLHRIDNRFAFNAGCGYSGSSSLPPVGSALCFGSNWLHNLYIPQSLALRVKYFLKKSLSLVAVSK